MQAVVDLASNQPAACFNTIALLILYTREEEGCLVRSRLVKLLDNLCSMSEGSTPAPEGGGRGEDGDEEGEVIQRVMAFQVLADRYVS